ILENIPGLGTIKKKEEAAQQKLAGIQRDPSAKLSPADIARAFQPVQAVVPPPSETWGCEKHKPDMEPLGMLADSMHEMGAGSTDTAVYQNATQNAAKAMDAAKQIASAFKPTDVGGLDAEVERLLNDPIRLARAFIVDPNKVEVGKINGELR